MEINYEKEIKRIREEMDEIAKTNSNYYTSSEYIRLQQKLRSLEAKQNMITGRINHEEGMNSLFTPKTTNEAKMAARKRFEQLQKHHRGSIGRAFAIVTGQGRKVDKITRALHDKKITEQQAIDQYNALYR